MNNTDVCLTFDDYSVLPDGTLNPVFSKEIKLPSLYDGKHEIDGILFPKLNQEEKNREYSKLITRLYKAYTKNLPEAEQQRYFEGTKNEVQTIKDTNMSDYFLIDYHVVKRAIEKGGVLTNSGRGCFTGDAPVRTSEGFKPISEIKVGDTVYDINGNWQKVLNKFEYDIEEPLIKITYGRFKKRIPPVQCTPDHKILVRFNDGVMWISADKIRSGDYVCLPKKGLTFDERKIYSKEKESRSYIYFRVTKTEEIPAEKTKVYDLEVENSHSFVISNMTVHNSSVGYFTNTLLGFSKVDRFQSPIKLYPERFISKSRILETKSLPD